MTHSTQNISYSAGFTLIETLVAVTILTIALVSPMSLVTQSLASARYARDQMAASHFAQEALEVVRAARDSYILQANKGLAVDIFGAIPQGKPFTANALTDELKECTGACPVIRTNGTLYGYDPLWDPTPFTREVIADYLDASNRDEILVSVTVKWRTGAFREREFTISELLYRWVEDES